MDLKINLTAVDNVSPKIEEIQRKFNEMGKAAKETVDKATREPTKRTGRIKKTFADRQQKNIETIAGALPGGGFVKSLFRARKRARGPPEGGGGDGGEGGGAGGGLSGIFGKGAGGMLGKLAAITIVAQGIMKGVQAIVELFTEASPMLQGVLKLLKIGFLLILKPLGDMLAMVLMPLARFLLKFLQPYQKRLAEAQQEGDIGAMAEIWVEMIQDLLGIMWDELVAAITEADWVQIFIDTGKLLYDFLVWGAEAFVSFLIGFWKWIGEQLYNALKGVGEFIWGIIEEYFIMPITEFATFIWGIIEDYFITPLTAFATFIWGIMEDYFITPLITFATFIWGIIEDYFIMPTKTFTEYLEDAVAEWLGIGSGRNVTEAAEEAGLIEEPFNLWDPSTWFQHGGIVTGPTRAIIGEAGTEVVFPLSDLKRFISEPAQTGRPNISMNVDIRGPIYANDLEMIINRQLEDFARQIRLA